MSQSGVNYSLNLLGLTNSLSIYYDFTNNNGLSIQNLSSLSGFSGVFNNPVNSGIFNQNFLSISNSQNISDEDWSFFFVCEKFDNKNGIQIGRAHV